MIKTPCPCKRLVHQNQIGVIVWNVSVNFEEQVFTINERTVYTTSLIIRTLKAVCIWRGALAVLFTALIYFIFIEMIHLLIVGKNEMDVRMEDLEFHDKLVG